MWHFLLLGTGSTEVCRIPQIEPVPAADENFNNDIVRGLLRREKHLDRVRIQDAGLSGATDPELLEWAE